ncbi:hypothetical protein D9611_011725 [Ephemerocybe angulata]|uniref:Uncharacterized protein n=1 Tax=Ephemerocybe angulata TaxID=980116 RepID=A0A8H5C6C8_9AGAR|nr:hypothetical protein D9611_011725 [Tulosesus angulatus]
MDSFTTLFASVTKAGSKTPTVKVPSNDETEQIDQGSGGYCVVFAKVEIPADEETEQIDQGSGGYCTIA